MEKNQVDKVSYHIKVQALLRRHVPHFENIHIFENAACMLTKPVTIEKFKHYLGLINISRC